MVDDDPSVLRTGQMVLTNLGYIVETASSAEEALELLKSDPAKYDLILTDYSMEDMNAPEFVHAARDLGPMPPFVVISGYILDEESLDDLFVGVVVKPFHYKELDLELQKHLKHLA